MSENQDIDKNLIPGHEYDGIKELDNPLPRWWLATFYGAIVFAAFYWFHFHISDKGQLPAEELKTDLAQIEELKAKSQAAQGQGGGGLEQLIGNPAAIAAGKEEFTTRCAACHGPEGGGLIGPNLTDNYWIHGQGKPADIQQVVSKGVLEKGMPSWETMLNPAQINNVVAFVVSLKGTNPANGKAPDGPR